VNAAAGGEGSKSGGGEGPGRAERAVWARARPAQDSASSESWACRGADDEVVEEGGGEGRIQDGGAAV
jgi:hypothetical protein